MVRRRAAASPDDVDETVGGEGADLLGHRLRAFVILAEGVGQAGVRICADERVRSGGDFGQVLPHRACAERAIEADGERARMAHRMPERGRRLAGKCAPRSIGDGARDHERHQSAAVGERLEAGEDRSLGVQRVENGLDEEDVRAAVDEPLDLLAIGDAELVETYRAEARIVDIGRKRGSAVRRPQGPSDEAAPSVGLLRLDRCSSRQSRPIAIKFVDYTFCSVVRLRDRGRREGVGLEDVCACQRVSQMDVFDCLGLGEGQEIIVALQKAVARMKTFAAKVRLIEIKALDLGAHRAVNDQDALACDASQRRQRVLAGRQVRVKGGVGRPIHSAFRSSRCADIII